VGAAGAPFGNAMVEAFWARMQVELLNRRRWKTRVELASAIHDYIEIWNNTKRRHSALNMLTPSEYENQHHNKQSPPDSRPQTPRKLGQITVSVEGGPAQTILYARSVR
jgi:transposase InsO family protein